MSKRKETTRLYINDDSLKFVIEEVSKLLAAAAPLGTVVIFASVSNSRFADSQKAADQRFAELQQRFTDSQKAADQRFADSQKAADQRFADLIASLKEVKVADKEVLNGIVDKISNDITRLEKAIEMRNQNS